MGQRILAIGDCHFPFINRDSLRKVYEIAAYYNPTVIIQLGDLYDMFSFSSFSRSLGIISPREEVTVGYQDAYQMWAKLAKLAPKAKLFQLKGNHDDRPMKRVLELLPEAEALMNFKDLFTFPKVEVANSERDEIKIGNILFMHGFRSRLGDHARHNGFSTVCGHSHKGGVVYHRLGKETLWELNAGFIADPDSKPLSYTKQRLISNWTQGCGYIDDYGPRFIPFENQ